MWGPCHGWTEERICSVLPDEPMSCLDILDLGHLDPKNRLWLVLRPHLLDAVRLRRFAVKCVRHRILGGTATQLHPATYHALDVAERFVNERACGTDLANAKARAEDRAFNAVTEETRLIAWAAAMCCAPSATRAANWASELCARSSLDPWAERERQVLLLKRIVKA